MKNENVMVVIDQSKENRRFKFRGVLVFFFTLAFALGVVFAIAAISANDIHGKKTEQAEPENVAVNGGRDVRYTLVGGEVKKDFITEEELEKQEEKRKKWEEEEAKKLEEEKKQEELKKQEEEAKRQSEYVPPKGNKIVYLTFDDGPGPYTAKLLDVLKKYDVKATFFVTCNRSQYRNMITRAYNEGHSIGLHSCSHDYAKVYASVDVFMNELDSVSNVVKTATGIETKLVRLPGGSSNTVSKKYKKGVVTDIVKELNAQGYVYFDWNVSSGDAGDTRSSDTVFSNVTKTLKGNYSIVLQHDIKDFSVDAVERIIVFGQKYGFTFKALDMNSPTAHHRINN